jgi:hypothetical protein
MVEQVPKAIDVLRRVAESGAAMSTLDSSSCFIESARPPLTHLAGTTIGGVVMDGTLVVDADGVPTDPGSPARSLGDLVRETLAQEGGV